MPEIINCPKCRGPMRVADHLLGRQVKCPSCGVTFQAGGRPKPPEQNYDPVEEEPETYSPVEVVEERRGEPEEVRQRREEFSRRLRWSAWGLLLVVVGVGLSTAGLML